MLADDIIQIRAYDPPMLEFFEMMVVCQLVAMEIPIRLRNDVDRKIAIDKVRKYPYFLVPLMSTGA